MCDMLKRDRLLEYIRINGGAFPLEGACLAVYGNSSRASVARCRALLSDLVKAGLVKRVDNRMVGWGETLITVEVQ